MPRDFILSPTPALGACRAAYMRLLAPACAWFNVNEFPKCGGTWVAHLVADTLGLAFRDNRAPSLGRNLIKTHTLRAHRFRHRIVVARDPRDVYVSLYYHSFFKFDDVPHNHARVDLFRRKFAFADYDDVAANIGAFCAEMLARPIRPRFTWGDFVAAWAPRDDRVVLRYEDMRVDPARALGDALGALGLGFDAGRLRAAIARRHLPPRRDPGRKSFARQGLPGGWRDVLDARAARLIADAFAPQMRWCGYV